MPPDDDGSWARVGELLIQRRIKIDPRYRNRRLFADERGVNWRLLHDIERAKRTNFDPETIAAIESAYWLAPGNIERILHGGGLEPQGGPAGALDDEPGDVTVLVLDPDDPVEVAILAQDKPEAVKNRELFRWKVQQGKIPYPVRRDSS